MVCAKQAKPLVRTKSLSRRIRPSGSTYGLSLPLTWAVYRQGEVIATGVGFTREVSSDSVTFVPNGAIPPGEGMELRIEWPAKLPEGVNLSLIVQGKLAICDSSCHAVEILRYEFRTRRK